MRRFGAQIKCGEQQSTHCGGTATASTPREKGKQWETMGLPPNGPRKRSEILNDQPRNEGTNSVAPSQKRKEDRQPMAETEPECGAKAKISGGEISSTLFFFSLAAAAPAECRGGVRSSPARATAAGLARSPRAETTHAAERS
jgi:hypothetical protein